MPFFLYDKSFNFSVGGLQYFHPAETRRAGKFARIIEKISRFKNKIIKPIRDDDRVYRHLDKAYRKSLHCKKKVTNDYFHMPIARIVPWRFLQRGVIEPMALAANGTTQAAFLALEKKDVVVNTSGGFHHASFNHGEGFCIFPDIPIAIKELHAQYPDLRICILDLDAHHGNGNTMSLIEDNPNIMVIDMCDETRWPFDEPKVKLLLHRVKLLLPLQRGTQDKHYIDNLETKILPSVESFKPDIIFYIAGTDPYHKDPLSHLDISKKGVIKRDRLVLSFAKQNQLPLVMLAGGGYTKDAAEINATAINAVF